MRPILQPHLPVGQAELAEARLPAMQNVDPKEWLFLDQAYSAQISEKARLLEHLPADVLRVTPEASDAAVELAEMVCAAVLDLPGFSTGQGAIVCPDGREVLIGQGPALREVSQLVQEDFCILQPKEGEAVLTAALLCFPASWTLAEKIGRPMTRIHGPVDAYDPKVAERVQRMFDNLPVGRVLMRANLLRYDDPVLYQPHSEASPRPVGHPGSPYLRSERQTLRRLPKTGAIAFGIHTSVVDASQQA